MCVIDIARQLNDTKLLSKYCKRVHQINLSVIFSLLFIYHKTMKRFEKKQPNGECVEQTVYKTEMLTTFHINIVSIYDVFYTAFQLNIVLHKNAPYQRSTDIQTSTLIPIVIIVHFFNKDKQKVEFESTCRSHVIYL